MEGVLFLSSVWTANLENGEEAWGKRVEIAPRPRVQLRMVIRLWLAKGQLAPEDLGAQQGKNPQKQEKQDEKGDNGLDTVDEWGKEVL